MSFYPIYPFPYPIREYVTRDSLVPGDFVILKKVSGAGYIVVKEVVDPYHTYAGFVTQAYNIGDKVTMYPINFYINNQLVGLTPGATYYADPVVPGGVTSTLPIGVLVIQKIGIAISATELDTQYNDLYPGTGGGSGTVLSVTGLNTDNTDPANPIVKISVDGVTIIGQGTPASPLVAIGGGGVTHEVLIDGGTFVGTTGTTLVDAGTFI